MPQSPYKIDVKDLKQWKLVETFGRALAEAMEDEPVAAVWKDARRRLSLLQYLSLFLLGLLNPAVRTTRALCEASKLKRVQEEICGQAVSLGSFSEAQHLVDPGLLEKLFGELVEQVECSGPVPAQFKDYQWLARDSSVFEALPRMAWALYGGGRANTGPHNAIRLHLSFHLLEDKPGRCQITTGQVCERKSWFEQLEKGAGYVGDRYFSKNFKVFGKLEARGCNYVIRLIEEATINVEKELPVSEADRKEGVVRQAWATLGTPEHRSARLRVVWVEGKHQALILVTNLDPQQMSAGLVSMLYRDRWQIETFFKWLKCLMGCRHWLAESYRGVQIQVYLALIIAVQLQLFLGRRPNKRVWEFIQLYLMGVATAEELVACAGRQQKQDERRKKNSR